MHFWPLPSNLHAVRRGAARRGGLFRGCWPRPGPAKRQRAGPQLSSAGLPALGPGQRRFGSDLDDICKFLSGPIRFQWVRPVGHESGSGPNAGTVASFLVMIRRDAICREGWGAREGCARHGGRARPGRFGRLVQNWFRLRRAYGRSVFNMGRWPVVTNRPGLSSSWTTNKFCSEHPLTFV